MFRNLMAEIARKNLTKQEVADKLGIHRNTLLAKLQGKQGFTLAEVNGLLEIFNEQTFNYLFTKE